MLLQIVASLGSALVFLMAGFYFGFILGRLT